MTSELRPAVEVATDCYEQEFFGIEAAAAVIEADREAVRAPLLAEIERLREANGILEDGLQEVGDDYPGSSCQEWCQHQIKQARAALAGDSHDRD